MIRIVTLCICIIVLSTGIANASLNITEIAWMGTADSQYGEWFEIYNDSDQDIDLSGWKLYEDDGAQLVFTFSKSIPANNYLLVERTTASSPDPVPGINDESGSFSGSGFANTGENLVLKDSSGSIIESLDFLSGWPAGNSDTKETMQWNGSSWMTAVATPKAGFVNQSTNQSSGGGQATTGKTVTDGAPKKRDPYIEMFVPKNIYSTVSSEYSATTFMEYDQAYYGSFLWNMGDGAVYKSNSPVVVNHTYKYPGTYQISFAYYRNYYDKKPFLLKSIERKVVSPKVIFSVAPQKGFEFTNTDSVPIDLSGWVIVLSDKIVDLPPLSLIAPKQTIIMPFESFGLETQYQSAILETPDRVVIGNIVPDGVVPKKENISENIIIRAPKIIPTENNLEASAIESLPSDISTKSNEPKQKNSKKITIFAVVLLVVIALFVIIERKASDQSSEE